MYQAPKFGSPSIDTNIGPWSSLIDNIIYHYFLSNEAYYQLIPIRHPKSHFSIKYCFSRYLIIDVRECVIYCLKIIQFIFFHH
jgi:hypothetical protein